MQSPDLSFTILDSVDSTNNYAMAQVHAGLAKHGDGWFAHHQTNGKGQRGKNWQSGNDENIALSIVIEPRALKISQQFQLSAAIALASFDFFSSYAGDETSIKWPNDIYWRDRKAGGILIENIISKAASRMEQGSLWKYAVAGIGINVNQTQFGSGLLNPVSLKQITGKNFNAVELARELQQMVVDKITMLSGHSFEKLLKEYNTHLYKKNKLVLLKKGSIVFETLIKEVSASGQLLTADRIDNQFDFGEIEWLMNEK